MKNIEKKNNNKKEKEERNVRYRGYKPTKTDLELDKPDKWEPKSKK